MKTFDNNGNIIVETPSEHYAKAIFLWKRDRRQNWDDLLNSSPSDLTKRVDDIVAEKEKAEKSGTKVPKIDEIIKMEKFREWAKTNEKYIDFVSRVREAKNDPISYNELKNESASLIKELAKEYKKVLAAA